MKKNILINENEGTLVLAKGFAKKAFTYGTKEYRMLQECRKDYPTYTVEVRSICKNANQDHYKGLTYENMEIYILTHENAEENLVIFNNKKEIAEMHSSCKRYGTIKNWFLETYPEVKEFGLSDEEIKEMKESEKANESKKSQKSERAKKAEEIKKAIEAKNNNVIEADFAEETDEVA